MPTTRRRRSPKPPVDLHDTMTLDQHVKKEDFFVGFYEADFCEMGFQGLTNSSGYDNLADAIKAAGEGEAIIEIRIVAVRPPNNLVEVAHLAKGGPKK